MDNRRIRVLILDPSSDINTPAKRRRPLCVRYGFVEILNQKEEIKETDSPIIIQVVVTVTTSKRLCEQQEVLEVNYTIAVKVDLSPVSPVQNPDTASTTIVVVSIFRKPRAH